MSEFYNAIQTVGLCVFVDGDDKERDAWEILKSSLESAGDTKELIDIVTAIRVLWTGSFPPATWAFHMKKLSDWLDYYNRGETKC